MKFVSQENLIVRESYSMPFGGAEIWFEQLDALSVHTDIVAQKFKRDLKEIRRNSTPSLVAVNLNETLVSSELAQLIVTELAASGRYVKKVAFVGLRLQVRSTFIRLLRTLDCFFAYGFFTDYEQAKIWLVS